MLTLVLAMAFVASTATVSLAKSADCEVKSVEGSTVTMDCGSDAGDLKAGDKVKVKPAKKKAIEGC